MSTVPPFCELTVNGSLSMKMVVTGMTLWAVGVAVPAPPPVALGRGVRVPTLPCTDRRTDTLAPPGTGTDALTTAEPPLMPSMVPGRRPLASVAPRSGVARTALPLVTTTCTPDAGPPDEFFVVTVNGV